MRFAHHIPTLIARRMRMYQAWGKSVAIDLHGCNHEKICDPKVIQQFIIVVVKVIDMKLHGPVYLEKFGEPGTHPGPGYSAMQFIETSSITVHMDEFENRAFIDIFSCKDFDDKVAANFAKDYFDAEEMRSTALDR